MLRTGILNSAVNFVAGRTFMAEEFRTANGERMRLEFEKAATGMPMVFEPHVDFKKCVPQAISLIESKGAGRSKSIILEPKLVARASTRRMPSA